MAEGAWEAFLELSAHRSSSGFGPGPITWQDIDAWQRVTGGRLSAFERKCVFALDFIYLKDAAAEMKQRAEATKARG